MGIIYNNFVSYNHACNIIPPKDLKLLGNITQDSYADIILNNTFVIFISIEKITYLIYCSTENSIICFNLENNQKINEIKNHHEDNITNFKHYLDKNKKRDLIMTISLNDNNIRIWNIIDWECITNIKNVNKSGYLYSACFLFNNNSIYIISSNLNLLNISEPIKIFDLKGKQIDEFKDSNDITYIIEQYYDSNLSINFIISGNLGFIKSYDFNSKKLYYKYYDTNNGIHLSVLIYQTSKIVLLIESCFDGYISIWNFHSGQIINKIKICKWLTSLCLWDSDILFVGCYDKSIKIIDIKNNKIIKKLEGHKDWVLTIKSINHPKYGKCLLSQGRGKDQIKMWINGN